MPLDLTRPMQLDRGIPALIIVAAVNADAGTANKSQIFAVPVTAEAEAPAPAIEYAVQPAAGGTITTLTLQLEASQDGGVTWNARGAAVDAVAAKSGAIAVMPGELYRIKPATLVLGTAASVSISVAA